MDCSLYVLSSPLVLIIAVLLGFTCSNFKNKEELEELYDYNDNLNYLLDETQAKLERATERLEKLMSNVD